MKTQCKYFFLVKTKILYRKALNLFLSAKDPSKHLICIQSSAESAVLSVEVPTPNMFKKKGIICIRLSKEELTQSNIMKQVIFIEMTKKVLNNLYGHFNEIYMPVLSHSNNQQGCSELMAKDLIEKFNNYLAQVYVTIGLIEGKTLLPLPPERLELSSTTTDKEKTHIFEGRLKFIFDLLYRFNYHMDSTNQEYPQTRT